MPNFDLSDGTGAPPSSAPRGITVPAEILQLCDDMRAARDERAAALPDLRAAREKFKNMPQRDGKMTDWPEFQAAEDAVKKVQAAERRLIEGGEWLAALVYEPGR